VIDTHCHIAGSEFTADLGLVIDRARAAGVRRAFVVLAAEDTEELNRAPEVAARWPEVRFAIGVHPHSAGPFGDDPAQAVAVVEAAIEAQPLTRAVGEIGLDYHYDHAPREAQQRVFRAQIGLARRRGLPLVLHTREAEEDTFRILEEEQAGEVGGVFHCFTGNRAMARRALDAGFSLSLSGIVTFPGALELQEVARVVPADRLLIETDSPFLAPVPHRGKRNEPARVVRVAEVVAELRGNTAGVVGRNAAENFARLFKP
jgi:TatD DNase family protein